MNSIELRDPLGRLLPLLLARDVKEGLLESDVYRSGDQLKIRGESTTGFLASPPT